MIREWLERWLTPAERSVRHLGYVSEVVAIGARERRHRTAWAAHLAATRAFVDALATGGEHLVVLGSGRLLDVPLETLAPRYARVTLVDCVHPRAARGRAAALGHVVCHEADVTGCVAALARGGSTLPSPCRPTCLDALPPPTATLSLNLLSQLPVMPLQRLEALGISTERQSTFGRALVDAHLAWLADLPGRTALITDVRREYRQGPAGAQLTELEDALHGARLPPPDARWDWAVAPRGEIAPDLALSLVVHAWADWKRSARLPGAA